MGANITTPLKRLGTWLVRADNTVYQAATDGFVCAFCSGTHAIFRGYTDNNNPPTTQRVGNSAYSTGEAGITMPVKKNDYWEVVSGAATSTAIFWIPLEP